MQTRLPTSHSPEDQAILEAAYNRDPKPDKKGRLDLVERVTLDEKEVQVCYSVEIAIIRASADNNPDLVSEPATMLKAKVTTATPS